jgi:hypothetical protein
MKILIIPKISSVFAPMIVEYVWINHQSDDK